MTGFNEDFFGEEEFLIDPEDLEVKGNENWDTGINPDIFSTGETPDIFSTKDAPGNSLWDVLLRPLRESSRL